MEDHKVKEDMIFMMHGFCEKEKEYFNDCMILFPNRHDSFQPSLWALMYTLTTICMDQFYLDKIQYMHILCLSLS